MKGEACGQGLVPQALGGLRGAPDFSVSARRSLGEVRDLPQVQESSWLQDRRRGARAGTARRPGDRLPGMNGTGVLEVRPGGQFDKASRR